MRKTPTFEIHCTGFTHEQVADLEGLLFDSNDFRVISHEEHRQNPYRINTVVHVVLQVAQGTTIVYTGIKSTSALVKRVREWFNNGRRNQQQTIKIYDGNGKVVKVVRKLKTR
jgi:hypothetical protein